MIDFDPEKYVTVDDCLEAISQLEAENLALREKAEMLESHIELLWRETDGILPSTGKMWLTPRMERETMGRGK